MWNAYLYGLSVTALGEGIEISESLKGLDKFLGVAEDRDEVGLWYREPDQVFELAVEDRGVFSEGDWKVALKKISAGLRPVRAI
jgi:hypothetical protein